LRDGGVGDATAGEGGERPVERSRRGLAQYAYAVAHGGVVRQDGLCGFVEPAALILSRDDLFDRVNVSIECLGSHCAMGVSSPIGGYTVQ